MMNYFTINTGVELVCFLISLICLSKTDHWIWKLLNVYLFMTLITELYAIYLKRHHHLHNAWLYNIAMLFEGGMITLVFFSYLFASKKRSKLLVLAGVIVVAPVYFYEIFNNSFFKYFNVTYTVMSVAIVIYVLVYFYNLLQEDIHLDLKRSHNFWWAAGILFFYFGSTACNVFYSKLNIQISPNHYLTYYIYNALNIILYGCWSYSFICRKWLNKTSKAL